MPSGKTHYSNYKKAAVLVPPLALLALASTGDAWTALGVPVGYFLGRWIDPDLDQVSITDCEGRMMRDLKLAGAIFVAWWLPYAYLMRFVGIGRKGHRNFFSHFPGVGTALRLLWLFAAPIAAIWWYDWSLTWEQWGVLFGVWIGLTFSDTIHYLADILFREKRNG
jgi:uncharacterized metal-binding protein